MRSRCPAIRAASVAAQAICLRELLDPRDQIVPLEGLGDHPVGAHRLHALGLLRVEVGRDDQDGDLAARCPQLLQGVDTGHVRHHGVEQDQVRLRVAVLLAHLLGRIDHLDPVGRGPDLVSLRLQPALQQQQHGLGVVGDQEPGHARDLAAAAAPLPELSVLGGLPSLAIGSTNLKVAPLPGFDVAEMAPPCNSTKLLAIARPSPVPPTAWVSPLWARQKRSKTCSSSSGSRPGPLSVTPNSTWRPTLPAVSRTLAPSGAYSLALVSRFESTCPIRSGSACTSGRSFSTLTVSLCFFSSNSGRIWRPMRWASGRTGVGSGSTWSLPASLRARSSRSLIIFCSCPALSAMISAASSWREFRVFGCAVSISAKPLTTVTGVRSSCETVSTKSSFIRSTRSRSRASRSSALAISLNACPRVAISTGPPTSTRVFRSPPASRRAPSTSLASGARMELIRPEKRIRAASRAPARPIATRIVVFRVSSRAFSRTASRAPRVATARA